LQDGLEWAITAGALQGDVVDILAKVVDVAVRREGVHKESVAHRLGRRGKVV